MTLTDAGDREKIVNRLDTNFVVEAAAGTGKTTTMVERIVNLLKHGHQRLAAVTFTHKAATELRQRLENRVAQLLESDEATEEEKTHLAKASASLADCHIGTIHSFCARLLRERPVEAGLNPDFSELDDSDDLLLRAQAWKDFARRLAQGKHRDLYALFETFGLDLDTLGQGFVAFANYPDIDEWIGRDAGVHQIDVDAFMKGVEAYYQSLAPLAAMLENADAGTDALMPMCQLLVRRYPRLEHPLALAEAFRLAGLFKNAPKITQKQWFALGLDKDALLERAAVYQRFYDETVLPFRNRCLAAVYAAALEAYHLARDLYDALRLENGVVNFQDLLLTTARMLRDYPEVRADLAEQYARLLVDEVQDTDPVQAEIMFLLASAEPRERDWRKCPPRPGALFIVGDPKQSIYRFRRADIVIYQEIKQLIRKSGGEILGLTSNFRSQPDILEWVNDTFCATNAANGCFAPEESVYSPAYVPLQPGLENSGDEGFHGVFRLETIPYSKKDGISEKDVYLNEAKRIARFIRHAIDTELPLPGRKGARPAKAGDFLVVTYEKSKAALYAAAIRKIGLECRVSSGGTLGNSEPLRLLTEYLTALENPENPVALTAVLRGKLFGISDPELYAWKKAGNEFSYLWKSNDDSGIGAIFAQMRGHAALFRRNSPESVLGNIFDDLGLWAFSAIGDDPGIHIGAVATAFALLRKEREAIPTLGAMLERLSWYLEEYEKDPLPAVESDDNAVRIMNLHKTKGLEAPVVFLTCTRGMKKHDARLAIQRSDDAIRGSLALRGGQHGSVLLARPLEWDGLAEEEERFLDAEKTRLNYVAATRAGAALVVSVHQSEKQWKTAFLPQYVHDKTIQTLLPEPEAAFAFSSDAPEQPDLTVLDAIPASAPQLLIPSYRMERAKPSLAKISGGAVESAVSPEFAASYGEVLHRLLANPMESDGIVRLLREFSLPDELAPLVEATVQKVRGSAIWKKAVESSQMFQEAPFTLYSENGTPTLVRGVIDLVFRDGNGWTIVDFKSDAVDDSTLSATALRHREQLRAYARAWEQLTSEKVVETGIYFLQIDTYFPLNTETQLTLF